MIYIAASTATAPLPEYATEYTLKAVLEQLVVLNKSTALINARSENICEFLQGKNFISYVQGIVKKPEFDRSEVENSSINSLNWTSEQNKWMTPQNKDIKLAKVKYDNPLHSTPLPKDLVKLDLLDCFNNITTDISESDSLDLSNSLESIRNNTESDSVLKSPRGLDKLPPVPIPRKLKPVGATITGSTPVLSKTYTLDSSCEPAGTTMTPL